MDRVTYQRMFNEVFLELNTKDTRGIEDAQTVRSKIEKILAPLIEKGEAMRFDGLSQASGLSTSRFVYRNANPRTKAAVQELLNDVYGRMGYEDASSAPFRIDHSKRSVRYDVTEERVLEDRTRSALAARAMRAGGRSTTDRDTGITTTYSRAGVAGKTREFRDLVDASDARYLEGTTPGSARADGVATPEERATHTVNKRERERTARQNAIDSYIEANPLSPLAFERARREQRVTNREERQRLRDLESDPNSQEFKDRVFRDNERASAREREQLEWARENPDDPRAKRILERHEREEDGGGKAVLSKAMASIKGMAISFAVLAIKKAVDAMVGFLSQLPAMASNLNKLANTATVLNVNQGLLDKYEAFSRVLLGSNREDLITGFMHSLNLKTANPISSADEFRRSLGSFAAFSYQGGGRTLSVMPDMFGNPNSRFSVVDLMNAIVDDTVTAASSRHAIHGYAGGMSEALRRILPSVKSSFGAEAHDTVASLITNWEKLGNRRYELMSTFMSRDNTTSFMDLMWEALGSPTGAMGRVDHATGQRSNEVALRGREAWVNIQDTLAGILLRILAAVEPIVNTLERWFFSLLNGLNNTGTFRNIFENELLTFWHRNAERNEIGRAWVEGMQISTNREVQAQIYNNRHLGTWVEDSDRRRGMIDLYRNTGLRPEGMTGEQARQFFRALEREYFLEARLAELNTDDAKAGRRLVSGLSVAGMAAYVNNSISRAEGSYRLMVARAESIHRYETGPSWGVLSPADIAVRNFNRRSTIESGARQHGYSINEDGTIDQRFLPLPQSSGNIPRRAFYEALAESTLLQRLREDESLSNVVSDEARRRENLIRQRDNNYEYLRGMLSYRLASEGVTLTIDDIRRHYSKTEFFDLKDREAITVAVDLTDRKNYDFVLKDERGNVLGAIRDNTNTYQRSFSTSDLLNSYRRTPIERPGASLKRP